MFKRFASATVIERISLPAGHKMVFAQDTDKPVSFDYDVKNFVYFRCRAMTADEPNSNGDTFPASELKKAYRSFIGVGLYKDHDSDSIDKAIGKVIWAEYVPAKEHDYVECICAVDRQLAPDLARRVEGGIATSVSMGASVMEAECSICHNVAHNPAGLCSHMIPGMGVKGRRNPDGSIIYEINRQIQFTELSLVTTPADPTARIFEVYANLTKNKPMVYGDLVAAIKKNISGCRGDESALDTFARAAVNYLMGRVADNEAENFEEQTIEQAGDANTAARAESARRRVEESSAADAAALKEINDAAAESRIEYNKNNRGGLVSPIESIEEEHRRKMLEDSVDKSTISVIHRYVRPLVKDYETAAKVIRTMPNTDAYALAEYLRGHKMTMDDKTAFMDRVSEMENAGNNMAEKRFVLPSQQESGEYLVEESREAGAKCGKAVAKKEELMEHRMGLSISYVKGSSLATSFLSASDNKCSYRVAASDVLPVIVQQAIARGETGVISPQQLVSDLQAKYSSMGDFKAWAKRRRKKNRKVLNTEKCPKGAEAEAAGTVDTAKPALTEEAAKPRVDELSKTIKAAVNDSGRNEMDTKKELEKKASDAAVETIKVETTPVIEAKKEDVAPVLTETKPEDKVGEILAAFESLRKYVESKISGGTTREAVKVDSIKAPADGEHGDKAVDIKGAINEIAGSESPKAVDGVTSTKGTMPKGAAKEESLKKEAIDKNWSLNQKELEKEPKVGKPEVGQPQLMSVDKKEMSAESVDATAGGKAGAQVKKFYNRLPAGGPGEAPIAWDAKSGQNEEIVMLRKALDEEKAAKEQLLQKEKLQNIADKVYEVVTAMKDNGLLVDGKESAVIDTLTARFADLGQLEGLKTLVAHLSPRKAAAGGEKTESDLEVGKVVPQVFESVESGEDAVSFLSRVWNQ